MGSKATKTLQDSDIKEIQQETGFSASQIRRLWSRFLSLDREDRGFLDYNAFMSIPELHINPLGERIVQTFFHDCPDGNINFRQFVRMLARFRRVKGSPDQINCTSEKLKFLFWMYDTNNDGKISKEDLTAVLHMMVGTNISEEQLQSIADRTIMEAKRSHQEEKKGKTPNEQAETIETEFGDEMGSGDDDPDAITFEEFCASMKRIEVDQKMAIRLLH